MAVELKLTTEQVAAAIALLSEPERRALFEMLKEQALSKTDDGWSFWEDAAEDIYNDLIPADTASA